jgi:cytochrome P450
MALHPEVQSKAQAEIDAIVGPENRLPTISDRDRLPYVCAVLKEVLRVGAIAPLGMPHLLREDDVYDGYFMPKGSVVIANFW